MRGAVTAASTDSASLRGRPRGVFSGPISTPGAAVSTIALVAADFESAAFVAATVAPALLAAAPFVALAFVTVAFVAVAFVAVAFVTVAFVTVAFVTVAFAAVAFAAVVLAAAGVAAVAFAAVAFDAAVLAPAGFRAITTAVGASLLSLYGFGSSPCADLRGERGPRPEEGRRGSVMSSMCDVVYWARHGAKSPARKGARSARHPFGTLEIFTHRAIWNDAGAGNDHDEKSSVGL